jgi:hypothetical protein
MDIRDSDSNPDTHYRADSRPVAGLALSVARSDPTAAAAVAAAAVVVLTEVASVDVAPCRCWAPRYIHSPGARSIATAPESGGTIDCTIAKIAIPIDVTRQV